MFSPHMGRRDKRSNKRVSVNFDPSLNHQTNSSPTNPWTKERTNNRESIPKIGRQARRHETSRRWEPGGSIDRLKEPKPPPPPQRWGEEEGGGKRNADRCELPGEIEIVPRWIELSIGSESSLTNLWNENAEEESREERNETVEGVWNA